MKIILHSIIIGIGLFLCQIHYSYAADELPIVRNRVVANLLEAEINEDRVKNLIKTISEDGSWPGINYKDVSRTGFEHGTHLSNMVILSRAYKSKKSKFRGNRKLKKAIDSSLDYWLDNDFICDNWWWNQIGTPNSMVHVLLIMDDDLTEQQQIKAAPIVGRAHLNASGARPSGDRIKIAGILAKYLLFVNDRAQFDEVIKVIEGEIKFATGRGMQYDYSFHHRHDRVNNTLSYGLGYASAFIEWAVYVADTEYSFSERKIKHLIDYYLDGICRMMVFGKYPDPGVKNRSVSRPGTLKAKGPGSPEDLMKTSDYRKDELLEIAKIRKGETRPTNQFNKFFWHSEYISHQRPEYFTSVRMFSSRNDNMEVPYNSEGLKNHHLGDGANFISRTGEEYFNIYPVYDWQKIPGTTVLQKKEFPLDRQVQKAGLTDFVGGVTNGHYGAAAFDYKSPHDPLSARKAWFFFDDEYVCLGSGINSRSKLPVATTLNQCLLSDNVVVMQSDKKVELEKGAHELKGVHWILHDSVGYIFPKPSQVKLNNNSASGSWYEISQQSDSPKEKINKDVFKLWFDHGSRPSDLTYEYIIVPSTTEQEIINNSANQDIQILKNTKNIQAVQHSKLNVLQAIFYKAGEIHFSKNLKLISDSPGMVMIKTKGGRVTQISVSDPNRELGKLHLAISSRIEVENENFKSVWNEEKGHSEMYFILPKNELAGKSTTVNLIAN